MPAAKLGQRRPELRGRLHPQARRQLDSALNINLDLNLHRLLHRETLVRLLAALHQKTLDSSLGSKRNPKLRPLLASMRPASHGQRLRRRRPAGHGADGRIVASEVKHYNMWMVVGALDCGNEAAAFPTQSRGTGWTAHRTAVQTAGPIVRQVAPRATSRAIHRAICGATRRAAAPAIFRAAL